MINLLKYIDRAYCINLDSRKDRWEQVSRQFAQVGLSGFITREKVVSSPIYIAYTKHLSAGMRTS